MLGRRALWVRFKSSDRRGTTSFEKLTHSCGWSLIKIHKIAQVATKSGFDEAQSGCQRERRKRTQGFGGSPASKCRPRFLLPSTPSTLFPSHYFYCICFVVFFVFFCNFLIKYGWSSLFYYFGGMKGNKCHSGK